MSSFEVKTRSSLLAWLAIPTAMIWWDGQRRKTSKASTKLLLLRGNLPVVAELPQLLLGHMHYPPPGGKFNISSRTANSGVHCSRISKSTENTTNPATDLFFGSRKIFLLSALSVVYSLVRLSSWRSRCRTSACRDMLDPLLNRSFFFHSFQFSIASL